MRRITYVFGIILLLMFSLPLSAQPEVTPEPSPVVITIDDVEIDATTLSHHAILERLRLNYFINGNINLVLTFGFTDDANEAFNIAVQQNSVLNDAYLTIFSTTRMGEVTVDGLVIGRLLRQTAQVLDVTIDEESRLAALTQAFNLSGDVFSNAQRLAVIEAFYKEAEENNIPVDTINRFVDDLTLRELLTPLLTDVNPLEVVVDSRHIMLETEAEALEIIAQLEAGAAFEDLAVEFSTDTASGQNGGALGVAPARNFVEPYAIAVTEGEIGVILGPVESRFGFHVIEVLSREEAEIPAAAYVRLQREAMDVWLDEQAESITITYDDPDWLDWIPDIPAFVYRPLDEIE